jgi:hypothetical protein
MSYKFLSPQDEEDVRKAISDEKQSSARYVPNADVKKLLQEIDMLRYDLNNKTSYPATTYISTDSETYNAGRAEGNADVAVELRKIVDPEDKKHLNLTGSLKEVERLVEYKEKAHEVITYIREADALKEFAYSNDDGPSIAELLRECYYLGEGYKDNIK